jgi:hypothetical protein
MSNPNPFTHSPRDGTKTPWLPRPILQNRISNYVSIEGKPFCVDGPTGTGKSSLVRWAFQEKRHLLVECGRELTMQHLTARVLRDLGKHFGQWQRKYSLELSLTPKILLSGDQQNASQSVCEIKGRVFDSSKMIAQDLADLLRTLDTTLIIDDFEKADESMVASLADATKMLTGESDDYPNARIVFVGTKDIFLRLLRADGSLQGRLEQVTTSVLEDKGASWAYLKKGFDALHFKYPGAKGYQTQHQQRCADLAFESAGGLLKALSQLGEHIRGRTDYLIPHTTIHEECQGLLQRSIKEYFGQLAGFIRDIVQSPGKKLLIRKLFQEGVGNVHSLSRILEDIQEIDRQEVKTAYETLCASRMLFEVDRGQNDRRFYIEDPRFAHVFGVVIMDPAKWGFSEEICKLTGQLELPMYHGFQRR